MVELEIPAAKLGLMWILGLRSEIWIPFFLWISIFFSSFVGCLWFNPYIIYFSTCLCYQTQAKSIFFLGYGTFFYIFFYIEVVKPTCFYHLSKPILSNSPKSAELNPMPQPAIFDHLSGLQTPTAIVVRFQEGRGPEMAGPIWWQVAMKNHENH